MPRSSPARCALRTVKLIRGYADFAEGSCLIEQGGTRVLCTASLEKRVPDFLKGKGRGWVTAEYAMLPRATTERNPRDAGRGKPNSRGIEISRLVGRALRAAVDLQKLGEHSLMIDCDVLRADGGTRCASITGGMIALADALSWMRKQKLIAGDPLQRLVAAVSVGIVDGRPALDLCYAQDVKAEVDMNFIMTEDGRFVEIQGTAEHEPFTDRQFAALKRLAAQGIRDLIRAQKRALGRP